MTKFSAFFSSKNFFIGSIAALVVPISKLYQNGIDMTICQNVFVMFGAIVPVLLMSCLVGCYAAVIKRKERDVTKLSELCVMMPAVFVVFFAGHRPAALPYAFNAINQVQDVQEVVIDRHGVTDGMTASINALVGRNNNRFWVVSASVDFKRSDRFIVAGDTLYYFVYSADTVPECKINICYVFDTISKKLLSIKT